MAVDFTDKVLEYQHTKNQLILKEIQKGVSKLIYGMIRKYGMLRYPNIIIEDIVENCRTTKLLAAIETYDSNRGAKFETHYSWYLRSECSWKKKYYLRRVSLEFTPNENVFLHPENLQVENKELQTESNIEKTDTEEKTNTEIKDCVLTSDWQSLIYLKKELREIFKC
jgi:DNA-directed RNA polymerase specialized sigma subunit